MCKQVICPNDGLPTWWGCGGHIEIALAGIPEASRCQCEHVPVAGKPGVYEVAQGHKLADSEKPLEKVENDEDKPETS